MKCCFTEGDVLDGYMTDVYIDRKGGCMYVCMYV